MQTATVRHESTKRCSPDPVEEELKSVLSDFFFLIQPADQNLKLISLLSEDKENERS